MIDCATLDEIIEIAAATAGPTLPVLEHVTRCDVCRRELTVIDSVRDAVSGASAPTGFTAGVMERVHAERALARGEAARRDPRDSPSRPRHRWRGRAAAALTAFVQGALIAAAIVTVLASAGADTATGGAPSAESPLALGVAFGLALLVGVFALRREDPAFATQPGA